MAALPPSYRRHSAQQPGQAPGSNDLPPYTRHNTVAPSVQEAQRELTEHVYRLNDGKGKVALKIYSSAKSPKSLPTFFERDDITGRLEISAEKGDSIHSITLTVTGRLITGAQPDDCLVFLNHVLPIWSKSSESPRLPSPSQGTSGTKLLGDCMWSFAVTLPRKVEVPTGTGEMRAYRLPETFLERHTKVSVQYELALHISRGKLRSSSEIRTAFGFIPKTRPDPPSLLRQLAYQQGCPLPGPSTDPQGWKTLRPVAVRGVLRKSRKIEVRCTLAIAKPLSYTRGTVIPCCLSIEGEPDVLNAFSSPNAVVASLRRRVRFYNKSSLARHDVSWNESVEEVSNASWWPSTTMPSTATSRHLEGEVRLPKDMRPSSDMGHFSISYSLALCPFEVSGFKPDAPNVTLISEPVEIATLHAKGPRVLPYSPPAYETPAELVQQQRQNDYVFTGGYFDSSILVA